MALDPEIMAQPWVTVILARASKEAKYNKAMLEIDEIPGYATHRLPLADAVVFVVFGRVNVKDVLEEYLHSNVWCIWMTESLWERTKPSINQASTIDFVRRELGIT